MVNLDAFYRTLELRKRGLKWCADCQRELPVEAFARKGQTRQSRCKACYSKQTTAQRKQRRESDPEYAEQARAYKREYERKRRAFLREERRLAPIREAERCEAGRLAAEQARIAAEEARIRAAEEAAALAAAQAAARAEAERIAAEERAARFAAAQAFATDRRIQERIVILKRRADYPMLLAQAKAALQRAVERKQAREASNAAH
jgi:hypothetical protein